MASIRSTIRIAPASVRLRRIPSCRADDGVGARVAGLYSKKKQPDDSNSSADRTDLCEGSSLDRHCHQECGEADRAVPIRAVPIRPTRTLHVIMNYPGRTVRGLLTPVID